MKVTTLHTVIQYEQSPWLAEHFKKRRSTCSSKGFFRELFHEIMINAFYESRLEKTKKN